MNANGERVYKLTGSTQYDDLNGSNPSFGIIIDGITLYPSPYIVLTAKQYTKHYYIGSEKIATMIGDGGILLKTNHLSNEQRSLIKDGFCRTFEPTAFQYDKTTNIDIQGMHTYQLEYKCGCIEQVDLYLKSIYPMLEPMMKMWQNSNGCKNEIYYTHSNHLGSANWITDVKGNPIQYIHYAPYGELIANQQTIGYDERFKFTGKERDWETGYDYFGARFYDNRKGIWNSVDPLADKYPNVTPYLYCNGNPIRFVDPDGRDIYRYDKETGEMKLYQKTDDNFDQIGKFRYNRKTGEYEPRLKKDGSIRTYTDHRGNNDKIVKGILRDGLNIKQDGRTFISDNNGGPTINDYFNFALILDEVAGVEISGFVLEAPSEKNKKIVLFNPYKDNSIDKSNTIIKDFAPYKVLQHFHTHGHADTYDAATTPSENFDIPCRNVLTRLYPGIQLFILNNYGKPIRY